LENKERISFLKKRNKKLLIFQGDLIHVLPKVALKRKFFAGFF